MGCQEVVGELQKRGHQVRVLTSWYGLPQPEIQGDIFRVLAHDRIVTHTHHRLPKTAQREWREQALFKRMCATFKPDIIYLWNMGGLPASLVYLARQETVPVAYYISDQWPSHFATLDPWYQRWLSPHKRGRAKQILHKALQSMMPFYENYVFQNAQFTSATLRHQLQQSGVQMTKDVVIPWGVDCTRFATQHAANSNTPKRLLYTGQIMPHKGVHTVIDALHLLQKRGFGSKEITLTVVGGSLDSAYEQQIQEKASACQMDFVKFVGKKSRDQMAQIYQAHDIYLFPSVWEEPFSIALVEAMASGLAVVCTTTGGSVEIAQHGVNCLTFPKEDATACADQIQWLIEHPAMIEQIGQQAQNHVSQHYDFGGMVNQIEANLMQILEEQARNEQMLSK